jgi:UDP-N-acetylmuramate dehydrogenase
MRMSIKKLLPGIKENVLLKKYSTFQIGGRAKYFFEAKTKEQIKKAIEIAKKLNIPFFIIGGGSKLLVADGGYKGLVIKIKKQPPKIKSSNLKAKIIEAGSGTLLNQVIALALKNNLTGLEWAIGIPGATIGGVIRGNAGAFGKSIGDSISEVEVYDAKKKKIKILKNKNLTFGKNLDSRSTRIKDCQFNYRESIFKKKKNLIILSAQIKLKKGKKEKIDSLIKKYLDYRRKNQPLNFPSVGSIFKNPKGFFAAELIEKCGLKGKKIGDVKISEKHANFIINLGKGKAKDVVKLINLIKKKVKEKFGVNLEEEIIYLGFKIRG